MNMTRLTAIFAAVTVALTVAITAQPVHAVSKSHATKLSKKQIKTLDSLSAYINGIKTMQGEFVQIGPDGRQTEGYFVVHRPGRILFRYKKPVMLEIVADGKALIVRDRKLDTQDLWPINKTPMKFLLKKRINLRKDGKVLDVTTKNKMTTVVMRDTTPMGSGKIELMFNAKNNNLTQWTVTDAQGQNTTVALFKVVFGKPTDPKWFRINHLKRRNSR